VQSQNEYAATTNQYYENIILKMHSHIPLTAPKEIQRAKNEFKSGPLCAVSEKNELAASM
jgi:hypothetical protein